MSAPTYKQLDDAIAAAEHSDELPAEIIHLMQDLRLPHPLQVQLKKLLVAGNPDRARKLLAAHEQHEGWWTKLRRKLGF
ncbi:MAG: hypothetical protein AB8H86_05655 [Polyangiales bacterium]